MNRPEPVEIPELVQIGRTPPAPPPRGSRLWRSLDELDGSEEFAERLRDEFPEGASEWADADPASRRHFLRMMGASFALAGASGCAIQPPESIVPYVKQPEEIVPGKPLFFATALPMDGFATGVLVESHMGRPTKVEGNPDHPASLGGTDIFAQAEPLNLYDPDRSKVVLRNGRVSTWDDFLTELLRVREAKLAAKGEGLRILTETVTSPTLAHQLGEILKQLPEAKWHRQEPVGRGNALAGARLAFGEEVEAIRHFDKADVVLALDADFLAWGPSRLRDARAFASRREVADGKSAMNRLYVVEPTPTITGAMAEHRLPQPASQVGAVAQALAQAVGVEGIPAPSAGFDPKVRAWIDAAAADLKAHKGAGLVLAGESQPPEVHALAHALNDALGNAGKTVEYLPRVDAGPADAAGSFRELVHDMDAGRVDTLLILGGNPAYSAPVDLEFTTRLEKLYRDPKSVIVHLGLHEDETSAHCHWHVPQTHPLETWGDLRAFDGTATVQQPLIAPLFGGRSAIEVLAALLTGTSQSPKEIVREYWKGTNPEGDFEAFWRKALRDGVVAGTRSEPKAVTLKAIERLPSSKPAQAGGLEIVFRPDPTVWDGRFANNGWLQELPKPLTRYTWDSAALISPAAAGRLGLTRELMHGEVSLVQLRYRDRTLRIPAWIMPGQAEDSVTVHLGAGRTRSGRVGDGVGVNAYALRHSDAPWSDAGLAVDKLEATYRLASVQHHNTTMGREIIRHATIDTFREEPHFAQEPDHHLHRELTLYEDPEPQLRREQGEGNSWGMAINLNTCIGCGACVVACQAENNIPVVGREQVLAGREMHWLRIDRYYESDDERAPEADPKTFFQPVPCMHCEKAPCELVCPVAATSHSAEGLNEMTYNRCVGTRYCGNNCPYKVRRFNFLQYTDQTTPSLKLLNNPDVTVRSRGVMEKCSYCVQRISAARIASEIRNEPRVGGNAVATACQGACPTRAIVFGNLNDPAADVVKAKQDPRNYALLAELNTRPRTTYLAKLTNPNPGLTGPHTEAKAE